MCAVVGVMFLRTHFFRKSEASDMITLLSTRRSPQMAAGERIR
jgi:hypothetical protein